MGANGENTRKIRVTIQASKRRNKHYVSAGLWTFWYDDLSKLSSVVSDFRNTNPEIKRITISVIYPGLPSKGEKQ